MLENDQIVDVGAQEIVQQLEQLPANTLKDVLQALLAKL